MQSFSSYGRPGREKTAKYVQLLIIDFTHPDTHLKKGRSLKLNLWLLEHVVLRFVISQQLALLPSSHLHSFGKTRLFSLSGRAANLALQESCKQLL